MGRPALSFLELRQPFRKKGLGIKREPGAPVSALMCSDRRLSCSRRPSAAGTLVSLLEFSDLRAKASHLKIGLHTAFYGVDAWDGRFTGIYELPSDDLDCTYLPRPWPCLLSKNNCVSPKITDKRGARSHCGERVHANHHLLALSAWCCVG